MSRLTPVPDIEVRPAADIDAALATLWRRWRADRDTDVRNHLLVHYAPLVRQIASRVAASVPAHVDFTDLVSAGVFGLLDAIDRFDPERGVPFEAYAGLRVRGAVLDALRAHDPVPRQVRARQRAVQAAVQAHVVRTGEYPSNQEIALAVGITPAQVVEVYERAVPSSMESLDELVAGDGEGLPRHERMLDPAAADPEELMLAREQHEQVLDAVASLPDREADVIRMYYGDHLTLREIGEALGVTESRASQLRSRGVSLLKAHVAAQVA